VTAPIVAPTAHIVRPRAPRVRCTAGLVRVGVRSFVPVVWPDAHHDVLLVTEAITEKPLAEMRSVAIDKPSWVLNGIGRMGASTHTYNPALDHLIDEHTVRDGAGVLWLAGREFQFWRDGVMRWQGPPVSAEVSLDGKVTFEAHDLGYYLSRRFFGAAQRFDLLHGIGSMDRAGLPGWVSTGGAVIGRDTSVKARGVGSMKVTGTGSGKATFTHVPVGPHQDAAVTVTCVARIPSGTTPGWPIIKITTRGTGSPAVYDYDFASVDDQTQFGGFHRYNVIVKMPLYTTVHGEIECFNEGTHGDVWFDDVRVVTNDTTGINPAEDLTHHGVAAVNSWQAATRAGVRFKSDFGFRPRVLHLSGTSEVMGVRHVEHTQATDWLSTMTDRDDSFDWWFDPSEFRRLWFSKRRGRDIDTIRLHDRLVRGGGWSHDESDLSSDVTVIGDDGGIDRAEGSHVDRSRTRGLGLDWAHRPANGTPLSALDPIARQIWGRQSQPQSTMNAVSVPSELIDDIEPGCRFHTDIRSGRLRTPAGLSWRMSEMALNTVTDCLELV
jgi:hypothetical protein